MLGLMQYNGKVVDFALLLLFFEVLPFHIQGLLRIWARQARVGELFVMI